MLVIKKGKYIWLALLLVVIASNIAIYNTQLSQLLGISESPTVVIGTLSDFLITAPLLALLYTQKFSWKAVTMLIAAGCIVARLIVPNALLAPYKAVTTVGIALEVAIIVLELALIGAFFFYIPKIMQQVRGSSLPVVFSFPQAVDTFVRHNPIIHALTAELLLVYYAFGTWKKTARPGITLHKNSSYIAFQIMMIHAIVLESLGFHWWLHSKAPILSIVLLLINMYGVIFFIADIQATRLNPIHRSQQGFYISVGLMKRTFIAFDHIDEMIVEKQQLEMKKQKDCTEFMVRDFEQVFPQMLLKMKQPQTVQFMYGLKRQYNYIAIKCDDPQSLRALIDRGMNQ